MNKEKTNAQSTIAPVDRKLPLSENIALGLQHTIIAILAAIPVPLIIAGKAGLPPEYTRFFISAIIFTAGICTLLSSLNIIPGTSPMVPMVMGAAFPIASAASGIFETAGQTPEMSFRIMAGATLVSGVFCIVLAPFWGKLRRFFPPLVVGINLMILGVALIPNTFRWMMEGNAFNREAAVSFKALGLAFSVFLLHVILSKYLKGFLGNLTILISLVVGTVAAIYLGMMDFSSVAEAPFFGINRPFRYGAPKFEGSSIVSFLIVMFLGMIENSGTAMGIHNIAGKEMDQKQLTKSLQTLGIGTVLSGGFNSVQPTAFVQNLGMLDLSKVVSRFTTAAAGVILLLVGFVPKFSAFIAAIPQPVLGGVGFAIFGIIIGSAVNLLKGVSFDGNQNMLIVGLSIGIAMIPEVFPNFYGEFANYPGFIATLGTILGSGILSGSIAAILLNLFFNFKDVFAKEKE